MAKNNSIIDEPHSLPRKTSAKPKQNGHIDVCGRSSNLMAEQNTSGRSSDYLAEQNAEDLSSSDDGLAGRNLSENGRRISVSLRICSESENEFHRCDDLIDMPELESVSPSSDQDSVPELESDSGNSEVQWGNPLNIELQGRWIQASVAVEEESDWLGSLSSDSAETQYPSDDGVSMGVEGDSVRAYIDDLAMVINRNDVNYEDDSANAQIPQIPQND